MPATNFRRIFRDNCHYAGYEKLHYIDSLARVVVDYVFSDKLAEGDCPLSMGNDYIRLYDFMTLVVYIIVESTKDFGDVTIKEWLYTYEENPFHKYEAVEYIGTDTYFHINNGGYELILALLWAAYIYARVRNTCEDKKWGSAVDMLYNLMLESSGLNESAFKKTSLITQAQEACRTMVKYIKTSIAQHEQKKDEATANKTPALDNSQYVARINELEKELQQVTAEKEQLKQQVEVLQSPEGAPIDTDGHGAVRMELVRLLMEKDGADLEKHGNKVIAARLMEAITGLANKTCRNHLSDPNVNQTEHKQEILEINSKLQALGMSIRL